MTWRSEARGLKQVHPVQETPVVTLGCHGEKETAKWFCTKEGQYQLPELLPKLIEIESPSGDVSASEKIAELLTREFSSLGCTIRTFPTSAGVHLVIDLPAVSLSEEASAAVGGALAPVSCQMGPLVFVGHTDTVWDVGTLGERIPFIREGDTVRGPGVYDMKAGIVIMHEVLREISAPHPPIRIILVADEEVGSGSSKEILLREVSGALCVLGFESPHPDGALKVGRYGSTVLRISVKGRAAHAALRPEDGIHAIVELLSQIGRIQDIVAPAVQNGRALCNVGVVQGGERANVIPEFAWCSIGLRFLDLECENQVLEQILGLEAVNPAANVSVEIVSHRPAWAARAGDIELAEQLTACVAQVSSVDCKEGGSAAAQYAVARGAGDTNFVAQLPAPVVDGLGPRGGGAHALDEHIFVSSLWERVRLVRSFIQRFSAFGEGEDV